MPGHNLFAWHERIRAVEREFLAASLAGARLRDEVRTDPSILPEEVKVRDVRVMTEHLEGTYLVRLFAAFEAGLRTYWETVRTTIPPSRDLIDGIAAMRRVPDPDRDEVHAVREYRNGLVHLADEPAEPIPLATARKALQTFFSRLPPEW
jgi:hypothetical protein